MCVKNMIFCILKILQFYLLLKIHKLIVESWNWKDQWLNILKKWLLNTSKLSIKRRKLTQILDKLNRKCDNTNCLDRLSRNLLSLSGTMIINNWLNSLHLNFSNHLKNILRTFVIHFIMITLIFLVFSDFKIGKFCVWPWGAVIGYVTCIGEHAAFQCCSSYVT